MIFTPISHLRGMLQHRASIPNNPYHDQHIITLEVSRLSRSTQQLCELIDIIREKRLRLVIVGSITIDCREGKADPMSEAFLQMAGVFSQLESAMIRARVKSGMENAKAKGKKIGRRPTTKEDIQKSLSKCSPLFIWGTMIDFTFLLHNDVDCL